MCGFLIGLRFVFSKFPLQIKSVTDENLDLKEQLSNALEHHTSKSVGSLGSEFSSSSSGGGGAHHHHQKTPSSVLSDGDRRSKTTGSSSGVSSDLSDSETEHQDLEKEDESSNKDQEELHLMEESGIFDTANVAPLNNIGTQTQQVIEDSMGSNGKIMHSEDVGSAPGMSSLDKFKALVESQSCSPTIVRHASDYESCEELDDLKEECRTLVTRKNSLEDEIEGYKGEIKTLKKRVENYQSDAKITQLERLEYSLRNQLKEWENKYNSLHQQNQMLLEEKCELEEAENDSRLNAQR